MRKSLAFAAASLITVPAYADSITYTLTPLGLPTQPGCTSNGETAPFPNSINDAGRVVGIYCGPQGAVRGFFWTPQQGAVDIGLPPDVPDNMAASVFPSNINNQDEIVGTVLSNTPNQQSRHYAFAWTSRQGMTVIVNGGDAVGINDPGQMTGGLITNNYHAFLYLHGTMRDLGTIPGAINSNAAAINNLGHIAGSAYIVEPSPAHESVPALLWTGSQWRDLGTPAGDVLAYTSGINNFDEIVGVPAATDASGEHYHAFEWNAQFTALPCPSGEGIRGCSASAINDAGTIVGATSHAVNGIVWIAGQVFYLNALIDPNDPLRGQVYLLNAGSINNPGEIAVLGQYTSGPNAGKYEAFVLSPGEPIR